MTVAEGVGHLVDVLAGRRLVEPPLRLLVQRLVHLAPRRVLLQIPIIRRSNYGPNIPLALFNLMKFKIDP